MTIDNLQYQFMSDNINDLDKTDRTGMNQTTGGMPVSNDKTIVPGHDDVADKTIVADRTIVANNPIATDKTIKTGQSDTASQPGLDDTFRAAPFDNSGAAGFLSNVQSDTCFTLKGEQYVLVRSLSESSGEAQVYLVSREGKMYVLKVYYPNFDINKKLMRCIYGFQFEMIVRLYDFGKTYVDGKHRCYELMEYMEGGSLQEFNLNGDINQFRRLALQAAGALAYCHKNKILHKDIKPSNFFFRDKGHSQLVLGDFGISSMLEKDGTVFRTTQARTPIYAAPEMYVDVIDGEVEITTAADYYSLGITLFALWLGENPMSSNERVMMRQKNEGRLPRLDELPPRVRQIVQGLTVVNPQKRWKYEEVERWFLGEDVPVDVASPFLRYKAFIVDPDRNLVADNLHELIPLLLDNQTLGINYLYNGRIATWLETCGNIKLSSVIKDIVTNRYPVDQKAGLMAAVYAMEPTFPYYDVQDEMCEDVSDISISLLSNKERYAHDLQNQNDRLYLWLEQHTKVDVKRIQSYFTPDAEPHVAVMRMVYEIDPTVPFLSKGTSSTIEEIISSFGHSDPTDDDWLSLTDGRLLSWMYSHEDVMACESLRIMTQDQPHSKSLAYKVLYNLDRTAAYDLLKADNQKAVGECLSEQLQSLQHATNEELAEQMKDFLDSKGRFYYYAQLHGWYREIEEANRCYDLNSTENTERLSAYDLRTALYRYCRILGYNPVYLLPNGVSVHSMEELENPELSSFVRSELRHGALLQWTSVYFHENPNDSFAEEYSYERALEKWVLFLGKLDEQQLYYKRYMNAKEDTIERIEEVRHDWRLAQFREKIWRYVFYALTVVWMALILLIGVEDASVLVNHPYLTTLLPLGGMTGVIISVRSYFGGFGPFLSFLFGILGVCSALIPIWILKFVSAWDPSFINVAVIGLTLVYLGVCHLTDFRKDNKSNAKVIKELLSSDDVNTSLLEPLYYTFKTKSRRYKSTKFGLLDDISNQVGSSAGENVIHYVLWGLLMLILIIEFCILSPSLLDKRHVNISKETMDLVNDINNNAVK